MNEILLASAGQNEGWWKDGYIAVGDYYGNIQIVSSKGSIYKEIVLTESGRRIIIPAMQVFGKYLVVLGLDRYTNRAYIYRLDAENEFAISHKRLVSSNYPEELNGNRSDDRTLCNTVIDERRVAIGFHARVLIYDVLSTSIVLSDYTRFTTPIKHISCYYGFLWVVANSVNSSGRPLYNFIMKFALDGKEEWARSPTYSGVYTTRAIPSPAWSESGVIFINAPDYKSAIIQRVENHGSIYNGMNIDSSAPNMKIATYSDSYFLNMVYSRLEIRSQTKNEYSFIDFYDGDNFKRTIGPYDEKNGSIGVISTGDFSEDGRQKLFASILNASGFIIPPTRIQYTTNIGTIMAVAIGDPV